MEYDLVIRGGTVVDGSGLPGERADVGIVGERIARIGRFRERGRHELDASGCVVTPGFVDGHTHMDAQVMWDPEGTSSCWHGVTTVVMGNCGFTLAPARADERPLVVRNLERAEDISPAALAAGIDWTWETFAEYLDAVDRQPKGLNYAAYVGHSALRTWAMGERAFEGPATDDDVALMERELRDALLAGAIGFTTSRSDQHETSDNRPVASRLAAWDEVSRLVGLMGEMGVGIFELTPEVAWASPDPAERREFYGRLHALALSSGVPFTFGLSGVPPRCYEVLDLIDETAAAGGRMFGQSHSRGVASVQSFKTRLAFDVLPEWHEVRSLPHDEQLRLLREPEVRKRLVYAAHHGDYGRAIGAEARRPDFAAMTVLEQPVPPNPSVAALAAERNVDPVELIIDLAVRRNFDQFFVQAIVPVEPEAQLRVMKHPRTVMTFSDSGAHVSQIADASIQTHLLAHWVRDRQLFSLEEAVRMLTYVPAYLWGFSDRGLLREGLVADVNVFDPERVGPAMPTLESDLPGGAIRLVQRATGFRATLVAGQPVLREGQHTGARPGRLLRGPLARAAAA
jgi:N-acyl-D-aspartate/D-glutamate deacylase